MVLAVRTKDYQRVSFTLHGNSGCVDDTLKNTTADSTGASPDAFLLTVRTGSDVCVLDIDQVLKKLRPHVTVSMTLEGAKGIRRGTSSNGVAPATGRTMTLRIRGHINFKCQCYRTYRLLHEKLIHSSSCNAILLYL